MINPIGNNTHNVCFKELQDYVSAPECKSSSKNKQIAQSIIKELMKPYPDDKKGRSFLERANYYNQDVCLTEGTEGGVKVTLYDKKWKNPIDFLCNWSDVGTYTEPDQFTLKDILEKYKTNEDSYRYKRNNNISNCIIKTIFYALLIIIFGILMHKNSLKQKTVIQKTETELVKTK